LCLISLNVKLLILNGLVVQELIIVHLIPNIA
jgi:hypothetical protein